MDIVTEIKNNISLISKIHLTVQLRVDSFHLIGHIDLNLVLSLSIDWYKYLNFPDLLKTFLNTISFTIDVSQEQHMQLYIEQHIYKHNLVNYIMCKGHIPLLVFQKILFGNVC